MKTRVSPSALALVLAGCVGVLILAFSVLSGTGSTPSTPDDLDAGAAPVHAGTRAPASTPLVPASDPDTTPSDSRVAIAGDPALAPVPQVEYELRTEAGAPVADARVVLFRDEELLGSHKSDAAGLVSFDAGVGSARAVVASRSLPAAARDVPLAAGRHAIVLERGTAVSGRVRIVGAGSPADVELVLRSDRALVDDSAWPAAVREALDLDADERLRLVVRTGETGTFEFTGLATPWSGRLVVGDGHEVAAVTGGAWSQGSDTVRLDDPIEGLLIDVVALPLATGRVVLSPGGPGVPRASVSGGLAFENFDGEEQNTAANFDGRTRDDGSFALPIRPRANFDARDLTKAGFWPPLARATLTLDGGEGFPRRRLELGPGQLPERFDFGELVLERGRTLEFVVVDAESRPLAGAVGRLDGERSEPTGEDGRGSIAYAPGVGRPLNVGLDGYRDARVDVPPEVTDALSVVLQRTNRLTVVVRSPEGTPVADVPVQLSTQVPAGQRQNRRGNRMNEQRTDGEGRATFSDFPAEAPLRLVVRDALGAPAAEQVVTLAPDEWRTLEVTLTRTLRSFAGVVRDEQGLALAEAGVEFVAAGAQGRNSVATRSDVDGRFSFSALTDAVGTLRVRKTGFAPVTIAPFELPPPGVIADIRMERGLRIALRVVDERGAPVRGDSLRLEVPGERPFQGRRLGDNEWEFGSLPRTTLVAVGMVGGREYRRDIEPLNGDQDFRVPVQGSLEISLRLGVIDPQASLRLVLRARNDKRVNLSREIAATNLQTSRFDPLLPGDYVVEVLQYVPNGPRGDWQLLGAAQRVQVAAGPTVRLDLER